jgi:acetyl-CoA C-acetyltransferase
MTDPVGDSLLEKEIQVVSDNTPIIVGVGQFVERLDQNAYCGLSPADIAARAAEAAISDAGGGLRAVIDIVGGVRTFEDSTPAPAAFGKPDKYPLAVAKRLGIVPRIAVLEKAGGQSPLTLVMDLAERLRTGDGKAALVFGSEAISTVRNLSKLGETRDWKETLDGIVEDHGRGTQGLTTLYATGHGVIDASPAYALCENARRARLGLSREDYALQMGRLLAPFTRVAAENPYASSAVQPISAEDIAAPADGNRRIADPYRLKMVSRDQVNQGAALLLTTVGHAREAGIDESLWIYIHGAALANEPELLSRMDPGTYPAAELAVKAALNLAGKSASDMAMFDFYSCFPTAVFTAAIDGLGLDPEDPRGLTVTGGLPYFGGPGNNYSMHAIAAMSERLRQQRGAFGLVGLNGGFQSKYGAVVLSGVPTEWTGCEHERIQEERDEQPRPTVRRRAEGWGKVLTYTVTFEKDEPALGIIIGEFDNGERFFANAASEDVLKQMVERDPIGERIFVTSRDEGNRFAFDRDAIRSLFPTVKPAFRDKYEHILVRRDGHLLEVTINRPEARNSLPVAAHHELSGAFDAYEADPELWVAIITGAGDRAFCAGADLKAPRGLPLPHGGFAGLATRSKTKPVIAAVNGFAFGGGFETALACELVVAEPTATFALSEVKVGMFAGAGGAIRLPRQLPRKIAYELLLTGRPLDAETAARFGFVNRISEPGQVMETARGLAREILAGSPTSVRLTMQVMREGEAFADADAAAKVVRDSLAVDALLASDDMVEGTTAFAQKRPPQWKNR